MRTNCSWCDTPINPQVKDYIHFADCDVVLCHTCTEDGKSIGNGFTESFVEVLKVTESGGVWL